MRQLLICSLMSLLLFGCGPAEFGGLSSQSKTSATGEFDGAGGVLGQDATDDAGGNIAGEDADDAAGMLPPMTADEAAGLITGALGGLDPSAGNLEQVLENELSPIRCYISHSGGHGMDMCMANTAPVQFLSPRAARGTFIEIKGNQLCVPLKVFLDNKALFATAKTGKCGAAAAPAAPAP